VEENKGEDKLGDWERIMGGDNKLKDKLEKENKLREDNEKEIINLFTLYYETDNIFKATKEFKEILNKLVFNLKLIIL